AHARDSAREPDSRRASRANAWWHACCLWRPCRHGLGGEPFGTPDMSTKNHISCAALVACAACSSNDGTTVDHQDQIQIAGAIAASSHLTAEPAAFSVLTDLATGILPDGLSIDGTGRFTGAHQGLVIDGTVTCHDLG